MSTGRSVPITAARWFMVLVMLGAVIAISGCAPSRKEVAEATFGPRPDRCERVIQQQMDLTVFSGQPGEYIFKEPYKAAVSRKFMAKKEFGWVVEFRAKGPIALGTGGYRTYHYFVPSDGTMSLLMNDATIYRVGGK